MLGCYFRIKLHWYHDNINYKVTSNKLCWSSFDPRSSSSSVALCNLKGWGQERHSHGAEVAEQKYDRGGGGLAERLWSSQLFAQRVRMRRSRIGGAKAPGSAALAVGTRKCKMRWAKNWSGEAFEWCMLRTKVGSVWSNIFLSSVNGTTGESLSLTVEERKLLTEEWIQTAIGRWVGFMRLKSEKTSQKLYLRNVASI